MKKANHSNIYYIQCFCLVGKFVQSTYLSESDILLYQAIMQHFFHCPFLLLLTWYQKKLQEELCVQSRRTPVAKRRRQACT